jgi:NAD(P)-dependent dehydrogenase (short-subunit alcohol dehydrogenase family)
MNRIDLAGRVAIVTGAAQGIGFASAQRLAASGAKVMIWDVDRTTMEKAAAAVGAGAQAVKVDVTNPEQVEAAREATIKAFGKVDILVCNAGIAGPNAKTWDYKVEDWRRVIDLDLTGVFLCCRALAPHMMANRYGRIVNIASIAGKEGNPNASAYSAAKAGVIGLTKSLGKELAESGVLVNCITPAAIRTAIFDQITQAHVDYMLSKIPMGRLGQVEEAAAMVAWLSSEDCSFSTGAVFDLSGGRATY